MILHSTVKRTDQMSPAKAEQPWMDWTLRVHCSHTSVQIMHCVTDFIRDTDTVGCVCVCLQRGIIQSPPDPLRLERQVSVWKSYHHRETLSGLIRPQTLRLHADNRKRITARASRTSSPWQQSTHSLWIRWRSDGPTLHFNIISGWPTDPGPVWESSGSFLDHVHN